MPQTSGVIRGGVIVTGWVLGRRCMMPQRPGGTALMYGVADAGLGAESGAGVYVQARAHTKRPLVYLNEDQHASQIHKP
jgi:hypothetical protein